jgi:hypothetical protein
MSVMRASDQDREEAIRALSDHFADGRLDHAEFDARMARAHEATYVHELDPLFDDLPARHKVVEPHVTAAAPAWPMARPRPTFVPFLVLAGLAALVLTHGHAIWLLFPLWFLGFSVARRLAWRRRAWAYAALPQQHGGPSGPRGPRGPHHGHRP